VTFVIARFLLGVAEAGFFPGVAYFMTCWFPSRYRGRAMGVFFAVGASAGILVGPVSANLLRLDGWLGIAGWQWVFLAEGLPTLALAAMCPFVLRDGPADAARRPRYQNLAVSHPLTLAAWRPRVCHR